MKNWKKKYEPMGTPIDGHKLCTLHLAQVTTDALALLVEVTTDAHYTLRKLEEEYTRWGMTNNPSKTEYLEVGNVGESLELRNIGIKITSSYNIWRQDY